jgi:hypothetical protein
MLDLIRFEALSLRSVQAWWHSRSTDETTASSDVAKGIGATDGSRGDYLTADMEGYTEQHGMRRYIITGTPGAGKTAIIRQLELDGFSVIEEAATAVIALA